MSHSIILHSVFSVVVFLLISCILLVISKRWSGAPYTALLILAGFVAQFINLKFGLNLHFDLSPDLIYFVLLPLLLFESSYHINIHHFRLQFYTVSALATFGLIISIFVVAILIWATTNLNIETAFLFGAIISSTDPISVIALFKQLGAPRRLGLVADGESMLNDATSVIAFKVVALIVLGSAGVSSDLFVGNTLTFIWVFIASIIFGAALGMLVSKLTAILHDNLLAMNLLATSVALFSFIAAEHWLALSGVITTVSFGVAFGNLAIPSFSHSQEAAFEHFWEFISLIALSIVFFFSAFGVNFASISASLPLWLPVICAVLIARSISVYSVCWVTNRLPLFKYEPNIPLSWQHVLNWGGLRGVIPLVLAYSLPLDYQARELLISLTIACFLFTLIVNGLTIKPLLIFLGLHRPARVEELYKAQSTLVEILLKRQKLASFSENAFRREVLDAQQKELDSLEQKAISTIASETDYAELLRSFKMAGNMLERDKNKDLFEKGYMRAEIRGAFDSQLNQQLDRIEYPGLPHRSSKKDLSFDTSTSWRNRIASFLGIDPANRLLFWIFGASRGSLLLDRFALLQIRLITSQEAVKFFSRISNALASCPLAIQALDEIKRNQESYLAKNRREMVLMRRAFPKVILNGQKALLRAALADSDAEQAN